MLLAEWPGHISNDDQSCKEMEVRHVGESYSIKRVICIAEMLERNGMDLERVRPGRGRRLRINLDSFHRPSQRSHEGKERAITTANIQESAAGLMAQGANAAHEAPLQEGIRVSEVAKEP